MSDQDRNLLDEINDAWDRRVRSGAPEADLNAGGLEETIDAIHRADLNARPSAEFRQRLRSRLLDSSPGISTPRQTAEFSFDAAETQRSDHARQGDTLLDHRRRWLSQTGELAALILILVTAIVGVVIWQSLGDGDGSSQPAATGDEDVDALPTPNEHGAYLGVTLEEAQALTPFDIRMPASIPDGYELSGIHVINEDEQAASFGNEFTRREDGNPWMSATLLFHSADNRAPPIQLAQRNSQIFLPGMPEPRQQPVTEEDSVIPADAVPVGVEDLFRGEIAFDGVEVLHVIQQFGDTDGQFVYLWHQDALSMHITIPVDYQLSAEGDDDTPDSPIARDELESMIESIITQRESDEQPPEQPVMARQESGSEVQSPQQHTVHESLTFGEAQELVPFDLIDPRDAHPGYEIDGVSVNEPPTGDHFQITARMTSGADDGRWFWFSQQYGSAAIPSPPGRVQSSDSGTPDRVDLDIDGIEVTQTALHTVGGDQLTYYHWQQDELSVIVYGLTSVDPEQSQRQPGQAVPGEDLEQFVQNIVESRQSDTGPPEPDYGQPPEGVADEAATPPAYQEMTLHEARDAVEFDLVDLTALPGDLILHHVAVSRHENGSRIEIEDPDTGDPNHVHIHLGTMADRRPMQVVQVIQTTDQLGTPEGDLIEIDGHEVTRISGDSGAMVDIAYVWRVDESEYALLVYSIPQDGENSMDEFETTPMVTEEDMQSFVRSTLP